ncbi:unnamed protein product [Didymodactylos carnosus]|uniref:Uncharacterized protein n=1 Tax=Didymodactylos carnosus TaxID=1234261 RepID=A0A815HZJ6_9BILA|nr:unnamed protein product [Didymodactylos carnosus]CAF4234722.1 unnamed protein product [Didymodactylos carnosus]
MRFILIIFLLLFVDRLNSKDIAGWFNSEEDFTESSVISDSMSQSTDSRSTEETSIAIDSTSESAVSDSTKESSTATALTSDSAASDSTKESSTATALTSESAVSDSTKESLIATDFTAESTINDLLIIQEYKALLARARLREAERRYDEMVQLSAASGSKNWYLNVMSSEVIPSYKNGYVVLQQKILNPLIHANIKELKRSNKARVALAKNIHCEAINVKDGLDTALTISQQINQILKNKFSQTVLDTDEKEKEIVQLEAKIRNTNDGISETAHQLSQAETNVRQKEHDVNVAVNNIRQANDDVDNAKHCINKRDFFKELARPFKWVVEKPLTWVVKKPLTWAAENIVVRPICSVFNSGGIRIAKDRRTRADNELSLAQTTVGRYRQQLNDLQIQKTTFYAKLNNLNVRLERLRLIREEIKKEQSHTSMITVQLNKAVVHLGAMNGRSDTLVNVLKRMVEFVDVITPLNDVYDEMLKSKIMSEFPGGQISANTIQQVKTSVDQLSGILQIIPWVDIIEDNVCAHRVSR